MCSSGIPLSFLQFEFFSRRIHFLRPTIPSFVQWWFKFEINNSPSVTLAAPPRPHALSIWWSIKCARLEQNVKTELNFGTIWEIDERDCSKGIICKKLFQNWLKTRKCIENSRKIWLDQLLPAARLSVLPVKRKSDFPNNISVFLSMERKYLYFPDTFQVLIYWMQINQRCQEIQTKRQ